MQRFIFLGKELRRAISKYLTVCDTYLYVHDNNKYSHPWYTNNWRRLIITYGTSYNAGAYNSHEFAFICGSGKTKYINYYLNKSYPVNTNLGLLGACVEGHQRVVRWMIKLGADCFRHGLFKASEKGHLSVVKLLVKRITGDYEINDASEIAARNGHLNVVRYLFRKSSYIYKKIVKYLFLEKQFKLLKWGIKNGKISIIAFVSTAADINSTRPIRFAIRNGMQITDLALNCAIEKHNMKCIKFILPRIDNPACEFVSACAFDFMEVVDLIIAKQMPNVEQLRDGIINLLQNERYARAKEFMAYLPDR